MSVDFFKYISEPPRSDAEFGIIDLEPSETTTDKSKSWNATVNNSTGKSIQFIAIDHKIPLYGKSRSKLSKRCDGMLYYPESNEIMCFVELKGGNPQHGSWLKDAIVQLQVTIKHFRENHPDLLYAVNIAYAANENLEPEMPLPISTSKNRFEYQTGFFLEICNVLQFPYGLKKVSSS